MGAGARSQKAGSRKKEEGIQRKSTGGLQPRKHTCWKFSMMATIMRGTAQAVALSVCTNSVLPPAPALLPFFFPKVSSIATLSFDAAGLKVTKHVK